MIETNPFLIKEPELIFGSSREEKDPRLGLKYFGPYYPPNEDTFSPTQARLGIIGTGYTIRGTKLILDRLRTPIISENSNRWLFPDYPGASKDHGIRCDFILSDSWNQTITDYEIQKVIKIEDVNYRINQGVNLFLEKVKAIKNEDSPPDVIICALPIEIEHACGISDITRGATRPKYSDLEMKIERFKRAGQTFLDYYTIEIEEETNINDEEDEEEQGKSYNFRNSLKGLVMEYGIPTQLLKQSNIEAILNYNSRSTVQHPSVYSWNLSTALYYKARGRPWRLAKLPEGSCYIGIAFYQNKLNPLLDMETSMAQVFTHTGEGFVLRGSDVVKGKYSRDLHLSESQSETLLDNAIKLYTEKVGVEPNRIVLHKTTSYSEAEIEGFKRVIGKTHHDFVSMRKEYSLKFLRTGKYPILRGTVIPLDPNQYIVYTTGYIPRLRTYPGHRIPIPLRLHHIGDSEITTIVSEILGLSKLNWNTTQFSTQHPITLEFARRVGRVLSELPEDREIQNHYRFYM